MPSLYGGSTFLVPLSPFKQTTRPLKSNGRGHFDPRATALLVQATGFRVSVTYNPGKDNLAADALFRSIVTNPNGHTTPN